MRPSIETSPSTPPGGATQIEPDWDALEVAVERNANDTESFLELVTGKVIAIVAGDVEAAARRRQVMENLSDYVRVEPASSREQYRWMERFVGSVTDETLRDRLLMSIDGKGAFRRFKDVLLAYPVERERWFSYRAELLHWHIHTWMQQHHLEPATPPPWGEVKPPLELPLVIGKLPAGIESPGESLRRQARDLIESIPAIDLPSVLAFLEFVRHRGAEALSRSRVPLEFDDDPDRDDESRVTC